MVDDSPALANGRRTTMMREETTPNCNTNWKRTIALQKSSESRQQLSDSIRASKANYGTVDGVNIDVAAYDDELIELIPDESPSENSRRRSSARGSFQYFVSRLSIGGGGGDYHRFMNSVAPHSQPSAPILPKNQEGCRKLTSIELFDKNGLLTREKAAVFRTSSL